MTTTRLISERDLVPHRAAGYELDESGEVKNQGWVAPSINTCADGALYFSVRDLAAWERALASRALLSPASYAAWWTPVTLADGTRVGYGFGWSLGEQRGEPVIEHGGSWQGFRAAIARYPAERLAVSVLANLDQAEPEALAHAIAGLVEPKLRSRDPGVAVTDPDPARTARLRGVLAAWASFDGVEAMAPGLAATASASAREAGSRRWTGRSLAAATAFRFLGEDLLAPATIAHLADGSMRAVDAVLESPAERLVYRFLLDARGRVTGFESEER